MPGRKKVGAGDTVLLGKKHLIRRFRRFTQIRRQGGQRPQLSFQVL
jgi:hypothetical protein